MSDLAEQQLSQLAVREKWERNKHRRIGPTRNLSFEQMIDIFRSEVGSLRCAAEKIGISRQGAANLYLKYVAPFLGPPRWHERYEQRMQEHRTAILARRESDVLAHDPALREIVNKARAAGCAVVLAPTENATKVRTRALYINGHLCRPRFLSEARPAKPNCRTYYSRLILTPASIADYDAQIIHVAVQGWNPCTYVVPNRVLRRSHPLCTQRECVAYVPMSDAKRKASHKRRMDFAEYREKWHLLAPKILEPDSS